MLNFALAGIFTNLAEIQKGKDGNFERVMEFTKAARTVRDYTGDIAGAYSNGTVRYLPGISDNIYKMISEYFDTGKITEYEMVKERYPEDLLKFIRISGLGKRRVFKIYDVLGLKSLEDLKTCVSDKSIHKKIYEKSRDFLQDNIPVTESNIGRLVFSLEYFEKTKNLYPKGYTDFFIEKILNPLQNFQGINSVIQTGSLRRKKSFIADMDFLVLPDFNLKEFNPDKSIKILKDLQSLSFIKSIGKIDSRKFNVSARYSTVFGIDMEIIITSGNRYHLDLFTTTGNKKHVGQMLDVYNERKVSCEEAINAESIKTGKIIEERSDSIIYDSIGIQYIPPELREGNDEIELASGFLLPDLIDYGDIKGDMHIHSEWSDGLLTMEDIFSFCRRNNYQYFALSDHTISNEYGNGLGQERFIKKIKYVEDLRRTVEDISILLGAEVDITGVGRLDYDTELLRGVDFVLGSMHSSYLNSKQENTSRVVSALENKHLDAIAHPTGVVFGSRAPYQLDMDTILQKAQENNKALEINSYLLRLDINEVLARQFRQIGGKMVINTDSHRADNLAMIKLGVEVARRAGLKKDDVLNTMTLPEIKEWRRSRL